MADARFVHIVDDVPELSGAAASERGLVLLHALDGFLDAGNAAEIAIQAEKVTTLIRVVNNSYFVAFSMTPDANIGKARYMLRTKVPVLLKELS